MGDPELPDAWKPGEPPTIARTPLATLPPIPDDGAVLVEGMGEQQYHADPCDAAGLGPSLSGSIAHKLVNYSERTAYEEHPALGANAADPTAAMDEGSIGHAFLLGTERDSIAVLEVDAFRSNAAKELRDAAVKADKTPLKAHQAKPWRERAAAWRAHIDSFGLGFDIDAGLTEPAVFWREGPNGVLCRAKLDKLFLTEGLIVEIKTCADARPRACQAQIIREGYDLKAAAYRAAVAALNPALRGKVRFLWLFCEKSAPHLVTPAWCGPALTQLGDAKWSQAVDLWHHALTTDTWPGYTREPVIMDPPEWALRDFEEGTL